MLRILIWDLPVRMFHWLLAGGFAGAALLAFLTDDEGPFFPYHAVIGLGLAALVLLRIVWGFAGSRHARFSSFLFGPASVLSYVLGATTGRAPRHAGHNPGSAWVIFAMLAMILGLATTGVMMARGNESVKEIHEILAWSMVALVGAHLLGVAVHTFRHRENITVSMITGFKQGEPRDAIMSSRPLTAAIFLCITGAWIGVLLRSYDARSRSLNAPLLGVLHLGEAEGADDHARSARTRQDDDED